MNAEVWLVIVQDGETQLIEEGGEAAAFVDGEEAAAWALSWVADPDDVEPANDPEGTYDGWTPQPGDDVADWPYVFACRSARSSIWTEDADGNGVETKQDIDIRIHPIDLHLGKETQDHYRALDDLYVFLTETCDGPEDFGVDEKRWQLWLAALDDRGGLY